MSKILTTEKPTLERLTRATLGSTMDLRKAIAENRAIHTLVDQFAAAALTGLLMRNSFGALSNCIPCAYDMAEDMLRETLKRYHSKNKVDQWIEI